MGMEAVYDDTGNAVYRERLQAWGQRHRWTPGTAVSPPSNPDTRAAIQVWQDMAGDGLPVDLAPSDRTMAADLGVPAHTYWWIDSLFMGLPLWSRWHARTGDPAYAAKGAEFYTFLRTRGSTTWRTGCTDTGLFDPTEDLWWRDCKFVPQRDALGHKVFWARGNGWVLGALARTLMVTPPADPQAAEYRSMLQRMSARIAALQGSDGMWRSSLLSPSLHPAPETSATALFTYAMAYGIRTGALDRATYLPVVQRAWSGLTTTALQDSGFLSNCQGVGDAPADPSTTTSIAYCVGAFALAASEVAELGGTPPPPLAVDPFTRTVRDGLGTATRGGPWTPVGPAAHFAVTGVAARLTTPAGAKRSAYLGAVSSTRVEVGVTAGLSRPATGSTAVGVLGRRVGAGGYSARAVVGATGDVQVQVLRSGLALRTARLPGLRFAARDRLRFRVQVTGTSPTAVRAKVWRLGSAEPTGWQVQASDASPGLQQPGAVGVMTSVSVGGPAAVPVALDDLLVSPPR